MALELFEHENRAINPLDSVEDVLVNHNWIYERATAEELVVDVAGENCGYRLVFIWQDSLKSLQIYCQYDMNIDKTNTDLAYRAISEMNKNLWLGHFEIGQESLSPCYRYTFLCPDFVPERESAVISHMVDVSLTQCEQYAFVFDMLALAKNLDEGQLSLAMMDTVGES